MNFYKSKNYSFVGRKSKSLKSPRRKLCRNYKTELIARKRANIHALIYLLSVALFVSSAELTSCLSVSWYRISLFTHYSFRQSLPLTTFDKHNNLSPSACYFQGQKLRWERKRKPNAFFFWFSLAEREKIVHDFKDFQSELFKLFCTEWGIS